MKNKQKFLSGFIKIVFSGVLLIQVHVFAQTPFQLEKTWSKDNVEFYYRNSDGSFLYSGVQGNGSQKTYLLDSGTFKESVLAGVNLTSINNFGSGIFSHSKDYLTICSEENFQLLNQYTDHKGRTIYSSIYNKNANKNNESYYINCEMTSDKKYMLQKLTLGDQVILRASSIDDEYATPILIHTEDKLYSDDSIFQYSLLNDQKIVVLFSKENAGINEWFAKVFNLETLKIESEVKIFDQIPNAEYLVKVLWNQNKTQLLDPAFVFLAEGENASGVTDVYIKSFNQNLGLMWEKTELNKNGYLKNVLNQSQNGEWLLLSTDLKSIEIMSWAQGQLVEKIDLPVDTKIREAHEFYVSNNFQFLTMNTQYLTAIGSTILVYDRKLKSFLTSPVKPQTIDPNAVVDTIFNGYDDTSDRGFNYSQQKNSDSFLFLRSYTETLSNGSVSEVSSLIYYDILSGQSYPVLENCTGLDTMDIKSRTIVSPQGGFLVLFDSEDTDYSFSSKCTHNIIQSLFNGVAVVSLKDKAPALIGTIPGGWDPYFNDVKPNVQWKIDESGVFLQNETVLENSNNQYRIEFWGIKPLP